MWSLNKTFGWAQIPLLGRLSLSQVDFLREAMLGFTPVAALVHKTMKRKEGKTEREEGRSGRKEGRRNDEKICALTGREKHPSRKA